MLIDLANDPAGAAAAAERFRAEVCIIGGGIAGLLVASRLVKAGVRVVLLEAGSAAPSGADDPFAAVLQGQTHAGTQQGRVCALGGTSLTWGGQLLPLPADAAWPVSSEDLQPFEAEAERLLGSAEPQSAESSTEALFRTTATDKWLPGMTARWSGFVPFGRRNLAKTLGRNLISSSKALVLLHARVDRLQVSENSGRVETALVPLPDGESSAVGAGEFVVAAGTVETCRLLLRSGLGGSEVGRNFADHLTVTMATVQGADRRRMLREWGPRVQRGKRGAVVRSLKLEPSAALRFATGWNAAMIHLTVEEPEGSGLGAVRSWLRARQGQKAVPLPWIALPRALVHAARWWWSARVHGRRFVSRQATVRLQLNLAQDAPSLSRIDLNEDGRALLHWKVSAQELQSLREWTRWLREHLTAAGFDKDVHWESALLNEPPETEDRLRDLVDDARHALGGACMTDSPERGVVDTDLRVHGVPNLSIASAAVFPDGRPQLPSLTMAALCLRLADRLSRPAGTESR